VTYHLARLAVGFAGLVLLSAPATATTMASCNSAFTMCNIPENILLQLPFTAISGDVVITDLGSSIVSDVFRIFNNEINTGAGTGLGNMAFLYSSDDSTPLPATSTYSANAVFITESPTGITAFTGNGTTYELGVPEPRTFELLGLAILAMAALARRDSKLFRRSVCERNS
jgi:hypothetical protein